METKILQSHINTKLKNFVDIPVRGLKWLLNKLKLRELFKKHVQDPKQSKSVYPIESVLMAGLQIHLFRNPSRHHFYQHLSKPYIHIGNLAHLAGIENNRFPSTRTLEDNYQMYNPDQMQSVLFSLFANLIKSKVFTNHPSLLCEGRYLLAIDAFCIHTYRDYNQHPCHFCPYCLRRQRDEKVWYLHMIVVASVISPGGFQFPLFIHRVRKSAANSSVSEQTFKEECELSSLPIILQAIRKRFPKLKFNLLLDALYSNGFVLDLAEKFNFDYQIVRKAGNFPSLNEEINGLKRSGQTPLIIHQFATERFKIYQSIQFFNQLIPASSPHSLNLLELDETSQKKPSKRFAKVHQKKSHWQWIVRSTLDASNAALQAARARHRWKEEDLGNSLKNRGFNLKHDFSHHPQAQSIWLYLMFMAFGITSLFLLSEVGSCSRKKQTIIFLMQQMLIDLLRFSFDFLFNFPGPYPKLLRFYVVPAAG
jgi:hypothetical protein